MFISYFGRSIAMVLLVLAFYGVQRGQAADAGVCYSINDADARQLCIARARADASQCYAIQRTDLRAQCLAEVRK